MFEGEDDVHRIEIGNMVSNENILPIGIGGGFIMVAVSDAQHPVPDPSEEAIKIEHNVPALDPAQRETEDQTGK